jgi:hypothetical protein
MKALRAVRLLSIPEIVNGREVIYVSIGPRADPIILVAEELPPWRLLRPSLTRLASSLADRDLNLRTYLSIDHLSIDQGEHISRLHVHHIIGDIDNVIDLLPSAYNPFCVQPLGNDRLLLVRGRARRQDHNAHVVTTDGSLVTSFHIGDGIADVQTTHDGQIWISYFDEGVFGGGEYGPAGAVRFDTNGYANFRFNDSPGIVNNINDCYAMNVVSNHEAWFYYYRSFSLVRLVGDQPIRQWPAMPVRGAHGFAIARNMALFGGCYQDSQALFLVPLNEKELQAEQVQALDEKGQRIAFQRAFGRGPWLYLLTDQDLYRVSVNDA